ncbi:MAG TPA: maleylpyruvate isomerase family mycothiol-dependent enzyme [Streptosporangiaceae bacterium]|nr:maleylpyruvate isomerase family mycothiol-dependent enzyme [Streptosporangiaceae bacterium]
MTQAGADRDRADARTRPSGVSADRPGPALAHAYQGTHAAILAILGALPGDRLSTVIPACPQWTVRDLTAHMTGVAADTVEGRFPPINPHGTWAERQAVVDAHTAGQVSSRQTMTMAELLGEWTGHLPRVLAILRGDEPLPPGSMPAHDWVIVSDIAAHGQDLRGALDLPGDRQSAAVTLGLQRYIAGLGQRLDRTGLPALLLRTPERDYQAGSGSPPATVTATAWELFRALGSRRSTGQILALPWSGDHRPYLRLLPAYGPRADDLIE